MTSETYGNCKTKGCEHTAPKGKFCRFCRGRAEDALLLIRRKNEGIALRPPLRCMLIVKRRVKKSKPISKIRKSKPKARR
jgi:hypothetical protein